MSSRRDKREKAKRLYELLSSALADVNLEIADQTVGGNDADKFRAQLGLAVAVIDVKAASDQSLGAALRRYGVAPGELRSIICLPPKDDVSIIARRRFFFEDHEACLKDGCNAVGGVWKATEDSYGCKAPEGLSTAGKVALVIAYNLVVQECNPVIRILGGILDAIF